jgi:hypothetical protein
MIRCKKCGRYNNLGGYDSEKELRRHGKGYCEGCILKIDELEMQGRKMKIKNKETFTLECGVIWCSGFLIIEALYTYGHHWAHGIFFAIHLVALSCFLCWLQSIKRKAEGQ